MTRRGSDDAPRARHPVQELARSLRSWLGALQHPAFVFLYACALGKRCLMASGLVTPSLFSECPRNPVARRRGRPLTALGLVDALTDVQISRRIYQRMPTHTINKIISQRPERDGTCAR